MMINSASKLQYQTIQQQYQLNTQTVKSQSTPIKAASAADAVTISTHTQDLRQKEQQIVGKYDVNNMSPAEMREMATKLNADGLISDEERLDMSFELRLDNLLGLEYDENQPIDYQAQFQQRYEFSKLNGGTQKHLNMLENMMGLMEHYKAMQN